jgi:hypothetical protein
MAVIPQLNKGAIMSAETANAARYDKGLMKLSTLEEELLEALEYMQASMNAIRDEENHILEPQDYDAIALSEIAISKAHGEEL